MNLLQMDELNEWEESEVEVQQRFEIDSIDSLTWAFRKLAAFKAKEAEITNLAKKERDRIDYWEAEQKKALAQNMEFFEGLIQQYHAKQLAADPKAKTLSTPYGKSKARATKAQPEKVSEEAILAYIKENELTKYIKESVAWGELKKQLKVVQMGETEVVVDPDGQQVPGVAVKPASITFSTEVE
jgi:hypothetical protein